MGRLEVSSEELKVAMKGVEGHIKRSTGDAKHLLEEMQRRHREALEKQRTKQ